MKISEDTLKNISQLSKLNIADSMKEKISKELESILLMVDKMNEVDTEQIEPMSHPLNEVQNLREDIISKDMTETNILKMLLILTMVTIYLQKLLSKNE